MAIENRPEEAGLLKGEQSENIFPAKRELSENAEKLTEIPASLNLENLIQESKPIFSSPEEQEVGVVEDVTQPVDHVKLQNDKKEEAVALEHLLADGEVTGNNAFDVTVVSQELSQ